MKKLLLVAAIIAVVISLATLNPPSSKADGYPLGADVITSQLPPVSTNISITITNTGSIAANVSATAIYVNTNGYKRVRTVIEPDTTYNAFIGYADTVYTNPPSLGYTNFLYLTGTAGYSLRANATGTLSSAFISERPHLWKDAISITVTSTLSASNGVTANFKLTDEQGTY